jgi:quinol monooxygenase YgiN
VGFFDRCAPIPSPVLSTAVAAEVDLAIVTMAFDAADPARLQPVLAKYVVLSRGHPGCRNIDLCLSVTKPERFVVIEKWDSIEAQRAHFDSADMVEMARSCEGLLTRPPDIDLLEGISAHDLA